MIKEKTTDAFIRVSKETRMKLKIQAIKDNISMRELLKRLADKLK